MGVLNVYYRLSVISASRSYKYFEAGTKPYSSLPYITLSFVFTVSDFLKR